MRVNDMHILSASMYLNTTNKHLELGASEK